MEKRLPIIGGAIVVIIIIAAAAVFTLSKKSQTPPQEPTVSQTTEEETQGVTSKGSIKDLIGLGKNVTCTITYPTDEGTSNGTVYVAGDKRMKGDFTINVQGKEIDSHMIQDGNWIYTWSSATPQGTKMKVEENVPTPTPEPSGQSVDANTQVDYKCSNWSVDNSKFVPPSDIQFVEFNMPALQTPTTTNLQQQSLCDQLTDPEAKAACLEAIESGN